VSVRGSAPWATEFPRFLATLAIVSFAVCAAFVGACFAIMALAGGRPTFGVFLFAVAATCVVLAVAVQACAAVWRRPITWRRTARWASLGLAAACVAAVLYVALAEWVPPIGQ
jgi:hypothetical protein